jgi:uncharacterized membrane protein YbaN (DUF454 family)
MTHDEIKTILLLYRPGTADANDPQVAEALALARHDAELARWLEEHCARQEALRAKFRQIAAPEGLKEQIISEHKARSMIVWWRHPAALAVAATVVLLLSLSPLFFRARGDDTFAHYQSRMLSAALRGYSMDLETNSLQEVSRFLAHHQAPADFFLPEGLQKMATATGCAVQIWQNARVSMVCFHTGKPLAPGEKSDLWLFVIERSSLKDAVASESPQFARVNRLITATWTRGDKVYLLGMEGDEQSLRQYL